MKRSKNTIALLTRLITAFCALCFAVVALGLRVFSRELLPVEVSDFLLLAILALAVNALAETLHAHLLEKEECALHTYYEDLQRELNLQIGHDPGDRPIYERVEALEEKVAEKVAGEQPPGAKSAAEMPPDPRSEAQQ